MPESTHPGHVSDKEVSKNSPAITRDEAMANASHDAGQAAQEREAAQRTSR